MSHVLPYILQGLLHFTYDSIISELGYLLSELCFLEFERETLPPPRVRERARISKRTLTSPGPSISATRRRRGEKVGARKVA